MGKWVDVPKWFLEEVEQKTEINVPTSNVNDILKRIDRIQKTLDRFRMPPLPTVVPKEEPKIESKTEPKIEPQSTPSPPSGFDVDWE